jgi:F0F1-type ATP synthase alpha subunit
MHEGAVVQLKYNNITIVILEDDRELEVAIDKSILRELYKVSIGDRFAIKVIDPPGLSRAYALMCRATLALKNEIDRHI